MIEYLEKVFRDYREGMAIFVFFLLIWVGSIVISHLVAFLKKRVKFFNPWKLFIRREDVIGSVVRSMSIIFAFTSFFFFPLYLTGIILGLVLFFWGVIFYQEMRKVKLEEEGVVREKYLPIILVVSDKREKCRVNVKEGYNPADGRAGLKELNKRREEEINSTLFKQWDFVKYFYQEFQKKLREEIEKEKFEIDVIPLEEIKTTVPSAQLSRIVAKKDKEISGVKEDMKMISEKYTESLYLLEVWEYGLFQKKQEKPIEVDLTVFMREILLPDYRVPKNKKVAGFQKYSKRKPKEVKWISWEEYIKNNGEKLKEELMKSVEYVSKGLIKELIDPYRRERTFFFGR